ncbi:MAG: HAMP domain-containing sensor histidine kinase [Candidatus Nanopelagicales bacterium]|nr:HAMP domain-containing sensor histidine kinase [Candidatus Nanopelagicales bacterium]
MKPVYRGTNLVTRMVLLTSVVAAIVIVIAGLISYPLVRSSELTQSRTQLSRLVDLTAAAIDRGNGLSAESAGGRQREALLPPSLAATLRAEQVQGFLVFDASVDVPGVPPREVHELLERGTLSSEGEVNGDHLIIEGRSLASGGAVILEQPVSIAGGSAQAGLLRFFMALFIGLLVAIPIGYFAASRIVRPLRAARDAAYEMQAGSRDVRLEPEGPSEVAEIALALNSLSDALNISERRQREFLLSVSHELRTPLTAVKGYAEALADDVIEPQDVAKTGATVAAEAQRLDRLVSDLLDLARLGAVDFHVNPASVDLKDIGVEAAEVWSTRCEREDVRFEQELPADELMAVTDPMRLRQIIDNLSENALRVSPSGSVVVLAMRRVSDGVEVEVRDSGPGLTSDDMAIAFEPGALYERYRGVRPVGTGLGLALVGRLAAGLGGYARVTTAPEGGACFTVFLPTVQLAPTIDLV